MFNLDEALRNHLAQRQKSQKRSLSPLVSPFCRHAQSQAGQGLSPVSPVSPPSVKLSPRRQPLFNG